MTASTCLSLPESSLLETLALIVRTGDLTLVAVTATKCVFGGDGLVVEVVDGAVIGIAGFTVVAWAVGGLVAVVEVVSVAVEVVRPNKRTSRSKGLDHITRCAPRIDESERIMVTTT
ncbi:MAG TPA: hypothetical protein VMV53_10115 [Acidimicrobiales bacterium]|nr:hypothetical protein [Acidimicrobiales bacterium]